MRLAHTIVNGFLAVTLLIATTGVSLHKHYCMGRLKSVAINVHAPNCAGGGEEKMPCCEDTSQQLKVEEITTVFFDFDSQPDVYEMASHLSFSIRPIGYERPFRFPISDYSPPPPGIDYQSAFQVFII